MYLPVIEGRSPETQVIDVFGGLNRSFTAKDNEFSDMENMSGEDFPYLSVREKRKAIENFTNDGEKLDLIIEDYERKDAYDKGTGIRIYDNTFEFYERGIKSDVHKSVELEIHDSDGEVFTTVTYDFYSERFCGMLYFGNNVIAFPSPVVVNKKISEKSLPIGIKHAYCGKPRSKSGGSVVSTNKINEFSIARDTGSGDGIYIIKMQSVGDRTYSKYYQLISRDKYREILYQGAKIIFRSTYETGKLEDTLFVVTDVSDTLGSVTYEYFYGNYPANAAELTFKVQAFYNGIPCNDIPDMVYNSTVTGETATDGIYMFALEADINLLALYQNRIWGTDSLGRSLYCSNATDFYDWKIDGTAAGGGYLDVPENTPWTAICEYGGYLYAFKANKMYKIMGSNSLDYSILQIADVGCVNHEATCICDSVLYFLARDGVYAFYGSQPACVSEDLGGEYKWGHFASRGQKLYASLEHMDGKKEFLVYDTARRMWHKEDDFVVRSFVDYTDGLYALGDDKECYKLEGGEPETDLPFSLTTKKYFYTFEEKAISSVNLYLDMGEESRVTVAVSYDGGEFVDCGSFTNRRLKYIPVRLRKCDEFQLRISGNGFIRLKQMEFVLHGGGRTIRF